MTISVYSQDNGSASQLTTDGLTKAEISWVALLPVQVELSLDAH